eukprot:m.343908 g.343908  ORF g.343908 m.343908 type:complete len:1136 (-) comp23516_c0_seq1:322-3729(-)
MKATYLLMASYYLVVAVKGDIFELFVKPSSFNETRNGNGTATDPYTSLTVAQQAVRELLPQTKQNVTVTLLAGNYFNTSLIFDQNDSPQTGASVTWQGVRNKENSSVVYGGLRVSGWSRWTPQIWSAPLPPELLDNKGRAVFQTLVQGDESAWLARSPDYGSGYLPCTASNSGFTCPQGVLPDYFDCVNSSCSAFVKAGYSSDIRNVTSVDLSTHSVTISSANTDKFRGSVYLQGALELLDTEGEWAVKHGVLYFWPYSVNGNTVSPNDVIITAPPRQEIISFMGVNQQQLVRSITLSSLTFVGASMPSSYTYACAGSFGAECSKNGGPDTPDETNTSPRAASQGMLYLENATEITITNCRLKAGGIAGIWMQEYNKHHTISGCWVEDMGGFGIYINGVGAGDRRYSTPSEANVSYGHTITNNLFFDGGRQIMYGSGVWLFQTGGTTITHNRIARYPRDGVGFYGMLPFWTANPNGNVAPGMPPAKPSTPSRVPWGKYVTWNGDNNTWKTWDILFNTNNYLGYNDISNCNRQGLDGGVVESWGSSINNLWEANAIHDNEVIATGLSLLFADDFSPGLTMRKNILYNNRCLFGNCAAMMIKSVNISIMDNIIADSNYSAIFEISAYRMPAANMSVLRNIVWNVSQFSSVAYSSSCNTFIYNNATWENITLKQLLLHGDGSNLQRSRMAQYGFSTDQLSSPVVIAVDNNFAENVSWLQQSSNCHQWDKNSIQLPSRPFTSSTTTTTENSDIAKATTTTNWYSRTYLDYAIDTHSPLVTQHGFQGAFNMNEIGINVSSFGFNLREYKRRHVYRRIQAEDYDRAEDVYTTEAVGLGSGVQDMYPSGIPPGAWARYDGVDFSKINGFTQIQVIVKAKSVADGATIRFQLDSPDSDGLLLTTVNISATTNKNARNIDLLPQGYSMYNSSSFAIPTGEHSLFMVYTLPHSQHPPDNNPHRYWRLLACDSDFNNSFYNKRWDVCSIELMTNRNGSNVATNPARAIASSGNATKAFNTLGRNCTQYDGRSGANSNYWTPTSGDPHNHQWIGYDFGDTQPVNITYIRLKQFPQQYCAATPSLQYSDNGNVWVTKLRLQCDSECPNNATEPTKGWITSPGPGTVAPLTPSTNIGAIVDWFMFRPVK